MANPQKENGYTPISNELLDAIYGHKFTAPQMAIIFFILRKTYGYNKKEDGISISQFEQNIPYSRSSIIRNLVALQLVVVVLLVKKGNSKTSSNVYRINKNYNQWQLVATELLVSNKVPTSSAQGLQLVARPGHTKDNTKENKREEQKFLSKIKFRTMKIFNRAVIFFNK